MACFVIFYDLHNENDYGPVTDCLEVLDFVEVQYSVWLVESDMTKSALRNELAGVVGLKNELMVIEFFGKPVWTNIRPEAKEWINSHF